MNDPEKKPETATVSTAPVVGEAGMSITPIESKELPMGTPGRVIPLKYPFKSGDTSLSKVTFTRRPKAGDLIQGYGAATPVEQELFQIAALLGVNPEDLKEMDGLDYLAVQKEWAAFLGVQ